MSPVTRAQVSAVLALALALPPLGSWFGADKLKHFLMTAFVHSAAYSVSRATGTDRRLSNVIAAAASVTVGVSKEVRDSRMGRPFSVQDLVWDAAGAGSMAALLARSR